MNALIAFIIGLLVILVILLPFYILSMKYTSVATVWSSIFCSQLA